MRGSLDHSITSPPLGTPYTVLLVLVKCIRHALLAASLLTRLHPVDMLDTDHHVVDYSSPYLSAITEFPSEVEKLAVAVRG